MLVVMILTGLGKEGEDRLVVVGKGECKGDLEFIREGVRVTCIG